MNNTIRTATGLLAIAGFGQLPLAANAESLVDAVKSGTTTLQLRPRYEYVSQEGIDKDAGATTLRTQLGYTTGQWNALSANVEFESVSSLGEDHYNSTSNGKSQYPKVLDPADAEMNLASLSYSGLQNTVVTFGRQLVAFDNQRFIGTVGWRQNETSVDALRIQAKPAKGLTLNYAYIDNVNRLFGEHHSGDCATGAACSDFDMSSHLINASYLLSPALKVVGYGYYLEFDDLKTRSQQTQGIQLTGAPDLGGMPLIYHLEYAVQSDYADGANTIDADYHHLVLGSKIGPATIKVGQETLSGDGTYGFSTPMATVHAFNGWADQFLATPADGLVDNYLNLAAVVAGVKLVAFYHEFSADHGSADYGNEIDFLAAKKVTDNLSLALKYASYSAEDYATDTDKVWVQADFSF